MNAKAYDQKTTFSNQDNFKLTLPSKEELKLQIEQLEGELYDGGLTLKRLIGGVAFLTPFWAIIFFVAWLAWH